MRDDQHGGAARAPARSAGSADTGTTSEAALAADAWARLEALRAEARRAGVCPVRPRLLRQIIKDHLDVVGIGLDVPHPDSLVVPRDALARLVDQEGYLLDLEGLPDPVLLIAEPGPEELTALSNEALRARLLGHELHARAHARLRAQGAIDEPAARAIAREVGPDEVEEAVLALDAEHRLFPRRSRGEEVEELIAHYLEQRAVAPALVRAWFPSLDERRLDEAIAGRWPELLEPASLLGGGRAAELAALRGPLGLEDADPTEPLGEGAESELEPEPPGGSAATELGPAARAARVHALLARAEHQERSGNLVGAIRLRRRAQLGTADPREVRARALEQEGDLKRLSERLHRAVGAPEPTAERWLQVLRPIVRGLGEARWSRRARLLYDLQKVCIDAEQPGVAVDLLGWLASGFRRPLVRTLTDQVPVRVHRHLRGALSRALALDASREVRGPLVAALRHAEHTAEARIRDRFRPEIEAVLAEVGLVPRDLPEEVAARKLCEGLLDRIVQRDYIGFGDLRDAISSNELKMQDLRSPLRLIAGDALLQADARLGKRLEGVYRESPFYMRFLQRLSSLAFGNRVGRALTRYAAIPFIGAFVALEGLSHMVSPISKLAGGAPHVDLSRWPSILLLGLFVLALIESATLRARAARVVKTVGRGARWLFRDMPLAVLRHPGVRRVLDSYGMAIVRRFVLKPLVPATIVLVGLPLTGVPVRTGAIAAGLLFLGAMVFINSRFGRLIEARLGDQLQLYWARFRLKLLPNIFRFVMETSRRVRAAIERLAYTVDELLRFRQGDARLALAGKLVGGTIWSAVMYVVQLYVNLLIEPQINPIKHFPVVTVSHKVILPATGTLIRIFKAPLDPVLGGYLAGTIAGITVFLLPGLFGFLVWELSANWRLYEASRSKWLGPVRLGGHGETMSALLRPGFHSGTIPKLYARIRRRALEAHRKGEPIVRGRDHEDLHHVVHAIERFIDRELAVLVERARGFPGKLRLGPVYLGSTQVRVEVIQALEAAPALEVDPPPLVVKIAERRGRLVASVTPGFAADLPAPARAALADALLGLFARADIDAVERPGPDGEPVERSLRDAPIAWSSWVARWEADRRGDAPVPVGGALEVL